MVGNETAWNRLICAFYFFFSLLRCHLWALIIPQLSILTAQIITSLTLCMTLALIGELFEWAVNAMLCGLIMSASIHVYFMYYCVMEYFTKILMCKNETQGGISSSILSVFFTDKFALSQSDARISVAYNSCQWKHWQNAWWNAPLVCWEPEGR